MSDQEAELMRLEFARQVDDQLLEMERERARQTAAIRDQELQEEQARLNQSLQEAQARSDAQKAMMQAFRDSQSQMAMDVLGATASFAGSISEIVSATMGEESEEAKKAARVMFGVQQAAALGSATVAMAEAIAKANASAPPRSISVNRRRCGDWRSLIAAISRRPSRASPMPDSWSLRRAGWTHLLAVRTMRWSWTRSGPRRSVGCLRRRSAPETSRHGHARWDRWRGPR